MQPVLSSSQIDFLNQKVTIDRSGPIGIGSHADVYRGVCNNKKIAVKISKDHPLDTKLIKEAKILQTLKHPNIVTLVGVASTGLFYWLVLDLLENHRQLAEVLEKDHLNSSQKFSIAKDICDVFIYLRTCEVYHYSMHNKNVLISQAYRAVMIDFGNACIAPQNDLEEQICRYHVGNLLDQIDTNRPVSRSNNAKIAELEKSIEGLKLSNTGRPSSPIKEARDVCWTKNLCFKEFQVRIGQILRPPISIWEQKAEERRKQAEKEAEAVISSSILPDTPIESKDVNPWIQVKKKR